MVRIHPHPPCRGSSVVEQRSEEPRVASSILAPGTRMPATSVAGFLFVLRLVDGSWEVSYIAPVQYFVGQ